MQFLILAAGMRHDGRVPCSVWPTANGQSLLEWQINTLHQSCPESHISVIVGYQYDEIVQKYPNVNFSLALNWETESALHSFMQASWKPSEPVIAMYADTVFHQKTIEQFLKISSDVVIAIDSQWQHRFAKRPQTDMDRAETFITNSHGHVEYTGLIKFTSEAISFIHSKGVNGLGSSFLELIELLKDEGFGITYFDVCGDWAEMNEPNDLIHFVLGTKAETLNRIRPHIKHSIISDQVVCSWLHWQNAKLKSFAAIKEKFGDRALIVRSSSAQEDGWQISNAGAFESILNIDGRDHDSLEKAIDKVFASYNLLTDNSQVLIQPFIQNTIISGVIFTCDLYTGMPYYIINYDDKSGSTEMVTSGRQNDLRTIIISHSHKEMISHIDARLATVVRAAKELQLLLGFNKLDIEFAVDQFGHVHTFQVRPIIVEHDRYNVDDKTLTDYLDASCDNFRKWQPSSLKIIGDYTLFSNMADWNPAEIIGARPNPLALSLYRHIITDEIWGTQRAEFGYRDLRPFPLVYGFCAQPYIDCRASLNSLTPSDLPNDSATRIINAYLNILKKNPHLHDKIEFEVAFTIWIPNFKYHATKRFAGQNVTEQDITLLETSLKVLTAHALQRLDQDIKNLTKLEERFNNLREKKLPLLEKAYTLIEDCKNYGTLSFAHAARSGFIAITFLKSLVEENIISKERMLQFQSSFNTITSDFENDMNNKKMSLKYLIKKYGHLRPGTYDVNQKAYWENTKFYFGQRATLKKNSKNTVKVFRFHKEELSSIQKILDELESPITTSEFINYLRSAIQAREKSKFIFTRNLSLSLDTLIAYGHQDLGLSRKEVGYMKWADIADLRTGHTDKAAVKKLVHRRMKEDRNKQLVKLPSFIKSESDFYGFEQIHSIPNFITHECVIAEAITIEKSDKNKLNNKIVLIPNADPGFDWLFRYEIAGLITKYGGANSHMAIRCAEISLPAAIGTGDKIYENIKQGTILLDCLNHRIANV